MRLAIPLLASLLAAGCGARAPSPDDAALLSLVTLPPQADLLRSIASDRVTVTTLVPEGSSPHTYEPVPSQLRAAARASVWFTVGSGVEFEVVHDSAVRQQNPSMRVVDTHEGIPLRSWAAAGHEHCTDHEHHAHTTDPHVWLTPANARTMADNTLAALIELDPASETAYRDGHARLVADLDLLDEQLRARLEPLAGSVLLVYHPSWGYFTDAYGLTQIAIEEQGRKPGIAGVADVVEVARRHRIEVVFASPQSDAASAEVVAAEIGGRVIQVDPLAADYRGSMRTVAEALAPPEDAP